MAASAKQSLAGMGKKKLAVHGLPPARTAFSRRGGIACPCCSGSSMVVDSRTVNDTIRRRRACMECGNRFTTWEVIGRNPGATNLALITLAEELRVLADRYERMAKPDHGDEAERAA